MQILVRLHDLYPQAASLPNKKKQLPLHLALRGGAPVPTVELFISWYPDGARVVDKAGYVPLHYACEYNAPVSVINALLKAGLPELEPKLT